MPRETERQEEDRQPPRTPPKASAADPSSSLAPEDALDHLPIGTYRTLPDGRILNVNMALVRMMGYDSREEMATQPAAMLYEDPRARDEWRGILEREGRVQNFEIRVRRKDGRIIWVRNSATAVRDAYGAVRWHEGVIEDITEQKQAEEALERRVEFERTLASISTRLVGAADLDEALRDGLGDMARLSGAGRAYLFLFRGGDEPLMDNTHEWCAPGVAPHIDDLQALPIDSFPWWMAHLRRGEAVHVRDVASLPEEAAAERDILASQEIKSALAFPVVIGRELGGFIGLDNVERAEVWRPEDLRLLHVASGLIGNVLDRHRAQAQLRISETRLRLLLDQAPLSIQVYSPSGTFLRGNKACERLWGMPQEELAEWNLLQDPQIRDRGILPYVTRALAGEVVATPPLLFRPDRGEHKGQDVWVRAVMYPVISDAGEVRELVIVQEDITETKRAEAELEASRHQLAISEKLSALGALVSGVAHEIRTPLTYVSNSLVLLDRAARRAAEPHADASTLADELARHVQAAQEGVDRITELVGDLRGYAKLRGGKRIRAELREVVAGAVTLFRATHRGQAQIEEQFEPGPAVEVDREQVQQVALNLMTNAAEAMQDRGTLRVVTRAIRGGTELLVEDTGPGLPPEVADHVFEPFFTTKTEGTGLGLSISKRLVESNNGTIRHEAREGGGARFVVWFPAAAGER